MRLYLPPTIYIPYIRQSNPSKSKLGVIFLLEMAEDQMEYPRSSNTNNSQLLPHFLPSEQLDLCENKLGMYFPCSIFLWDVLPPYLTVPGLSLTTTFPEANNLDFSMFPLCFIFLPIFTPHLHPHNFFYGNKNDLQ